MINVIMQMCFTKLAESNLLTKILYQNLGHIKTRNIKVRVILKSGGPDRVKNKLLRI